MLIAYTPGVLFSLQEAAELSSLKPQLDKLGVPLYAVVKENIGTEIQDFKPHFAGDIFLDEMVRRADACFLLFYSGIVRMNICTCH